MARGGQSLSSRVDSLGRRQPRLYPDELVDELRAAYERAGADGVLDLTAIATKWGKNNANLCRFARAIGLHVNQQRKKVEERKDRRKFKGDAGALKAAQSKASKERIAKNGHPRGFLGRKHSKEALSAISEKSAAYWAALSEDERDALTAKMVRAACLNGPPKVARGSWKAGWREIGGKRHYFRSRWEANYARWLQWLKERGDIAEWEFEPHTFWFDGIKRGVRSYKPDFRVTGGTEPDAITWHEVKGWMDARSHTTLKRMAKYHPDEIIILIREKQIKTLERSVGPLIGGWE